MKVKCRAPLVHECCIESEGFRDIKWRSKSGCQSHQREEAEVLLRRVSFKSSERLEGRGSDVQGRNFLKR